MLFKQHTGHHNSFCESYGLVVLTKGLPEKAMLVERKIPYCVQNLLLKKMSNFLSNKYIRRDQITAEILKCNDTLSSNSVYELEKDWYQFVQLLVSKTLTACKKETHLYDDTDFERYENGLVFEDQFDFPHGQMSTKTKKILRNFIHEIYKPSSLCLEYPTDQSTVMKMEENKNNEFYFEKYFSEEGNNKKDSDKLDESNSIHSISPTCNFLKNLAGFLTAFMEFEEETGYTFRFDLQTILKLKTIHIQFTGLDGYEYLQKFYILQVDKLNKLFRSHKKCNNYTIISNTENSSFKSKYNFLNNKKRKQSILREIDRQTYKARLLDVDEVVKLMWNQQKELGKWDFKHILPKCLSLQKVNEINSQMGLEPDQQQMENEVETIAENMFFEFTKRIDPDIFDRCVRHIKWREK